MKEWKLGQRPTFFIILGIAFLVLLCALFILNAHSNTGSTQAEGSGTAPQQATGGGGTLRSETGAQLDPDAGEKVKGAPSIRKRTQINSILNAPPMLGRPTSHSVTLTLKAAGGPVSLVVSVCQEDSTKSGCKSPLLAMEFVQWRPSKVVPHGLSVSLYAEEKESKGSGRVLNLLKREFVEMELSGLDEGVAYRWFLVAKEITPFSFAEGPRIESYSGRFVTQRGKKDGFTFDMFADPHLFSEQFSEKFLNDPERDKMLETFYEQKAQVEKEFLEVAKHINEDKPDFVVALGDPFDLHGLGFVPALTKEEARHAHAHARRFFSLLNESGAMYQVVGNWEGESGCHPLEARNNAIAARLLYQINPRPNTYADWTGSEHEDYYAFSWGNMLGVVLNVLGYDETCHQMGQVFGAKKYGTYKSFHLGQKQQQFVERTLTQSRHAYKVVFIHHALGGRSKDPVNADYGRGGYLAAKVGEQRWLHELMTETGVQVMFYGHDHVFTDHVVDNVHYTLPGTISAPWKFGGAETGYTNYNATAGHARVRVTPEEMKVEFVSLENKVIYSYQVKPNTNNNNNNNNNAKN